MLSVIQMDCVPAAWEEFSFEMIVSNLRPEVRQSVGILGTLHLPVFQIHKGVAAKDADRYT